jgi:hypothetical protein
MREYVDVLIKRIQFALPKVIDNNVGEIYLAHRANSILLILICAQKYI